MWQTLPGKGAATPPGHRNTTAVPSGPPSQQFRRAQQSRHPLRARGLESRSQTSAAEAGRREDGAGLPRANCCPLFAARALGTSSACFCRSRDRCRCHCPNCRYRRNSAASSCWRPTPNAAPQTRKLQSGGTQYQTRRKLPTQPKPKLRNAHRTRNRNKNNHGHANNPTPCSQTPPNT